MPKNSQPVFFFLYSLFAFSLALQAKEFSQADLERKAEIEGYGYKTANLMLLREILADSKLRRAISPISIEVPEFVALNSSVIVKLLGNAGIDLAAEWSEIVSRTTGSSLSMTLGTSLSEKTLPLEFRVACNAFSERIHNAFDALARLETRDSIFGALGDNGLAVDQFLTRASKSQWRLVVRSTGKEDTDKLANAGGNASELNVPPDAASLLRKIGVVIASYFKENSLTQRIIAGDQTIFDLPLTPVLIQRMVGEKLGGETDVSLVASGCVVYTVEPAAYSPINTLQCSFGSNEGVVRSLVALDTFYVEANGKIKSIVKEKFKRIIPEVNGLNFGLGDTRNPLQIQNQPSLNTETVLAISKASGFIDSFYKKRMDIELVYLPVDKTVYIVQARPLVFKPRKDNPSYISNTSLFDTRHTMQFITIVPGDAAVQLIAQKEQILIAMTLSEALEKYKKGTKDLKSKLIAVIAEKEVDTTSHEAAVFRGDGKIVLQSKNNDSLENWLENEDGIEILIDVQRGLAVNLMESEFAGKPLAQLFEDRVVKDGWTNYPLPMRLSVGVHEEEGYCVANIQGKNDCKLAGFEDVVGELGNQLQDMRKKADCKERAPGCLSEKLLAQSEIDRAENLYTHVRKVVAETTDKLENQDNLPILFSKRFVEALVYQEPSEEVVNSYSFQSLQKDIADKKWLIDQKIKPQIDEKKISTFVLKNPVAFKMALHGLNFAYSDAIGDSWLALIDSLSKNPEHLQRLAKLVDRMLELKIFESWINTKKTRYHLSWWHVEQSEKLLVDSEKYLEKLNTKLKDLKGFSLSKWENPGDYQKNRFDYDRELTSYFTGQEFLDTKNELELYAKISAMEEFLFLFDMTGKTLRGALTFYKSQELLVANFKQIVNSYIGILKSWVLVAPYVKSPRFGNAIDYVSEIERLWKTVLASENKDYHLYPSDRFSVMDAALGSRSRPPVPTVAEDFFTFSHQSCNAIINALFEREISPFQELSKKFQKLTQEINGFWPRVKQSSNRMLNDRIVSTFQMPLGSAHQAIVELIYFRKQNSYQLRIQYLGGFIPAKMDELVLTAFLWSSLHAPISIEKTSFGGPAITVDRMDTIPEGILKDLVTSLNRVTFIHHTELGSDYLTTVPIAQKVMKIIGGKDLNSDSELEEVLQILEKFLLSRSLQENKIAIRLLNLLKEKNKLRIHFYLNHFNLLTKLIKRHEKDFEQRVKLDIEKLQRFGSAYKNEDPKFWIQTALAGHSKADYEFLEQLPYIDRGFSIQINQPETMDLISRILTLGSLEDRKWAMQKVHGNFDRIDFSSKSAQNLKNAVLATSIAILESEESGARSMVAKLLASETLWDPRLVGDYLNKDFRTARMHYNGNDIEADRILIGRLFEANNFDFAEKFLKEENSLDHIPTKFADIQLLRKTSMLLSLLCIHQNGSLEARFDQLLKLYGQALYYDRSSNTNAWIRHQILRDILQVIDSKRNNVQLEKIAEKAVDFILRDAQNTFEKGNPDGSSVSATFVELLDIDRAKNAALKLALGWASKNYHEFATNLFSHQLMTALFKKNLGTSELSDLTVKVLLDANPKNIEAAKLICSGLIDAGQFKAADIYFSEHCPRDNTDLTPGCRDMLARLFNPASEHKKRSEDFAKQELKAWVITGDQSPPSFLGLFSRSPEAKEYIYQQILEYLKDLIAKPSEPFVRIDDMLLETQSLLVRIINKGGEYQIVVEKLLMKMVRGEIPIDNDVFINFVEIAASQDKLEKSIILEALETDRFDTLPTRYHYFKKFLRNQNFDFRMGLIKAFSQLEATTDTHALSSRKEFVRVLEGSLSSEALAWYDIADQELLLAGFFISKPLSPPFFLSPVYSNSKSIKHVKLALAIYLITQNKFVSWSSERRQLIINAVEQWIETFENEDERLEELIRELKLLDS